VTLQQKKLFDGKNNKNRIHETNFQPYKQEEFSGSSFHNFNTKMRGKKSSESREFATSYKAGQT